MNKQVVGIAIAVALGGAASCPAVYAQGSNPVSKTALQKPVTVNFQDTDIQAAIRTLLQNTGVQYSVDSDVRGTVTIALTNQPLQDALRQVLAAGGYTYQVDPNSGLLKIGAKLQPPPVAPPPAPEETIPTPVVQADEATRDNRTWQFIPVNNTLPEFAMYQLMQPSGISSIMGIHDVSQLPEEAQYSRGGGGGGGMMGGGMGGGMGGMGGGMMGGGMGGMGGGMMGGGMGGMGGGMMGGMGGGMGGMGGGMMGGMGGGMGGMGGGMMGGMGGGMGGMGGGMGRRY